MEIRKIRKDTLGRKILNVPAESDLQAGEYVIICRPEEYYSKIKKGEVSISAVS